MKKLFILVFVLSSFMSFGQNEFCGTHDDGSMRKRLIENKRSFSYDIENRDEDWIFIPIQFHIVNKTDGTGGMDEDKIFTELCHINDNYADIKMRFYISDDFNYINSNQLYSTPRSSWGKSKTRANRDKYPHAVNLFIVNDIESSGIGQTLGYYSPPLDVLIIRSSEFGGGKQTVSHELGHFFSLAHPFYGWDCDPYNASKHGNPLSILFTPCGNDDFYEIELMDGSNCNVAADALCDTPPDYLTGITDPEQDCKLNGPIMDHNGDTINTMENNYMSYYFGCGDYVFTPMQIAAMRADFASNGRSHIRTGYVPDTTGFDLSDFDIITPKNDDRAPYFDHVYLDWKSVPHAKGYILKVERSGLHPEFYSYIIFGKSETVLTELSAKASYRWTITPFSYGNTCGKKSKVYKFKTGEWTVGTSDFEDISEISIFPNPISNNTLYVESKADLGSVIFEIFDMTGKLVETHNLKLNIGKNKINLTHSNYQNGLYNIIIKSKDKNYIRKIFVKK